MKKFWLVMLFLYQILPLPVAAQSMISDKRSSQKMQISLTSFPNYFPFSTIDVQGNYNYLHTIFNDGMALFAQTANYELKYRPIEDYNQAVGDVRSGSIDVLLGMYFDSKIYTGLEYIYPAALNNPVHVAMLPENIEKIKTPEDLKSLKGLYIEKEYFSDYMLNNFKIYGIQPVKDAKTAYEKLFTRQADYVMGSYYYNYAEVCKLGLKDYVVFSKQPLWNMPLFIGISKLSRQHKKLGTLLKRFIVTDTFKQSIRESLKKSMQEVELNSQGIVPPKFVRRDSLNERTPADENPLQKSQISQ